MTIEQTTEAAGVDDQAALTAALVEAVLAETVLADLQKSVNAQLATAKATTQEALHAIGVERIASRLPDGTKVATVTAVTPAPKAAIADQEAFADWVAETSPDNVTTRTVFITEVRPAYQELVLEQIGILGAPQTAHPVTGELQTVPGVEVRESTAYHTVKFEKTGRAAVAAAWRSGRLSHLEALRDLATGAVQ